MGLVIEVNDRVSVELRANSFVLYVGDDAPNSLAPTISCEIDYLDAEAVATAVRRVVRSDRFIDDRPRRLAERAEPKAGRK